MFNIYVLSLERILSHVFEQTSTHLIYNVQKVYGAPIQTSSKSSKSRIIWAYIFLKKACGA